MFKIFGENPIFHQWDLDQKLIVEDSSVTEVHFSNGLGECALVCEVYEQDGLRLVNVPNILLQKSLSIMAYAHCTNYTKQSVYFKVIARSKPESYVYTETECYTVEAAVEKALAEAKASGDFKGDKGDKGDAGAIKFIVVAELAEVGDESAIYLLQSTNAQEQNVYDEYIFTNGAWEKIGTASVEVDLTDYVKKDYVATYQKAGLVKPSSWTGIYIADKTDGSISLVDCNKAHIDIKGAGGQRVAITTKMLDYAIKVGLTTNQEEWTEEEKQAARDLLGITELFESLQGGN